mgnify:CR=1 FL=1
MSSHSSAELPAHIQSRRASLLLVDIQRTLALADAIGDEQRFVLFLDEFYGNCSERVIEGGGEIVKYIGDACLALFEEDDVVAAVKIGRAHV